MTDTDTPWVSLLCAVVAMVRRDDCLVQLNDAEEAEQRARRQARWCDALLEFGGASGANSKLRRRGCAGS